MAGQKPGAADREAIEKIKKGSIPRPDSHPNVFAWYAMVSKIKPETRSKWTGDAVIPAPVFAKAEAAKPAAEEDELDLFGDDPEADAAAAAAMKKKAEEAKAKKKKAAPIAKSLIVWDVKPWGEETDLEELANKILAIEMDGLMWKTQWKKEPVAYGVFKIQIGATVEDDKVSTDLVQEAIEAFEDDV